jgi:Family of unknown function (DUF6328)
LTTLQQNVFFATLLCTATATALLIAPSAHHRLLWRRGAREERLQLGNLLTILGLLFLVPAMVGVIFVITDLMFGSPTAVGVTAAMAASFVLLWFLLPLRYRLRPRREKALAYLGRFSGAVTAPSDADETRAAYFAITPVA